MRHVLEIPIETADFISLINKSGLWGHVNWATEGTQVIWIEKKGFGRGRHYPGTKLEYPLLERHWSNLIRTLSKNGRGDQ